MEKQKQDEVRNQVDKVNPRYELEKFTKFSECHLWKLMMSFYERQGVDSWSLGIVPHFITSNAFIAKSYARVFIDYLKDGMSRNEFDVNEQLYIIELGAGSGKFSFLFVQALMEFERLLPFPLSNITYVMTDFTDKNVDFWKKHPALQEYLEMGLIDFAIFDATKDNQMRLMMKNTTLRPGSSRNPVGIMANYLFDTLYHDAFQVEGGVVKEGQVSVGSKRDDTQDPLDPTIIKRLENLYRYEPINENMYYEDEEGEEDSLNEILKWYKQHYADAANGATVLVPIGALRAIRRVKAISRNRAAFILSGDKGHNNPEHFRGLSDPHIAVHGSFSVMVNYHAIGIYCGANGGFALHNEQEEASIKVSAFVFPGESNNTEFNSDLNGMFAIRQDNYPSLRFSFEEHIVDFGPNDFFVLQKSLKEEVKAPGLKALVALLKLSRWDADVFYKFRDGILDQISCCGSKLRADLCRGLSTMWKHYYLMDQGKDIAFEIGRVYYGIRDYDHAIIYYRISIAQMGDHHVTNHNMGLCLYSQGQLAEAIEHFRKAVSICSTYEKARSWLARTEKELHEKMERKVINLHDVKLEIPLREKPENSFQETPATEVATLNES